MKDWPPDIGPATRALIERRKAEVLRRYNRPWWRVVRWWDRRLGR